MADHYPTITLRRARVLHERARRSEYERSATIAERDRLIVLALRAKATQREVAAAIGVSRGLIAAIAARATTTRGGS